MFFQSHSNLIGSDPRALFGWSRNDRRKAFAGLLGFVLAGLFGAAQVCCQEHLFRPPGSSGESRTRELADAGNEQHADNPFVLPAGKLSSQTQSKPQAKSDTTKLQPIKKGSLPVIGQPTSFALSSVRQPSPKRSSNDGIYFDDLIPPPPPDGGWDDHGGGIFQDEVEEIPSRTRQLPLGNGLGDGFPSGSDFDNQSDAIPAADFSREVVIQRYPDGKPQIERQVIQDQNGNFVNDGYWRVFSQTGENNLIAEGQYRRGAMHGIWKRKHSRDSSPLFQTTPFSLFEGPFISIAMFQDNRLEGMWVIMDEGERKIFEMPYREGNRHGTASWFYPSNEKMREVTFKDGLIHGRLREWDEQQKMTRDEEFVDGRKVVRNITYYRPRQAESETYYLDGKLKIDGDDDWWRAQPARLTTSGQQLQHGPANLWYDNGLPKMKGQYTDGVRVGKFIWWHPNGNKQSEGAYVKGRKEGVWSWWHPNGMKACEGNFENDLPLGVWTWWDEEGKVEQRQTFSEAEESDLPSDSILPDDSNRLDDLLNPMFQQTLPGREEESQPKTPGQPIEIDDLEDISPIGPGLNRSPNGSGQPEIDLQQSNGSVRGRDPFRVPLELFDD